MDIPFTYTCLILHLQLSFLYSVIITDWDLICHYGQAASDWEWDFMEFYGYGKHARAFGTGYLSARHHGLSWAGFSYDCWIRKDCNYHPTLDCT